MAAATAAGSSIVREVAAPNSARNLESTTTEYARFALGRQPASARGDLAFTGRSFRRQEEEQPHHAPEVSVAASGEGNGCGIAPRVHPAAAATTRKMNMISATGREDLRFATTALAALGGHAPRRVAREAETSDLKRETAVWHQHDPDRSSCSQKVHRPIKTAGVSSARLSYSGLQSCHRVGREDRPTWMKNMELLPGAWKFGPSANGGAPGVFNRSDHFTEGFFCAPRQPG
mmetsp:Transcript_5208/g.7313  ORF Transcript_5208/g.7313 Transcript_5208/m.7313 type:complete len:232 (+) Transcript_5208:1-696(+)|eukprot:CAMPEP_0206487472 /NCGR_PEP_ID=MMETSP0324_2-20121206/41663_1 /ASSEMBLY_ACC=CAM_ASM_000836 /TAXON_ID=2866 /ORGANISM="Crypthecodinium cohnii, Strain Seligo" /LENGTH=231 /DNA_ID=CAMNT_0053965963 /DNA_START=92 /DNA_END=787 /DNA_ORIENTATION=+